MKIRQTIKIELEANELEALRVIKDAYEQCIMEEIGHCDKCPLHNNDGCIGRMAEDKLIELGD